MLNNLKARMALLHMAALAWAMHVVGVDKLEEASVGVLIEVVLVYMVLFLILAAVFTPVDNALANYALNETTMGPVIHAVWWILIGAGILLGMIYTLLRVGRETGGA
jgi:hypothetical protein